MKGEGALSSLGQPVGTEENQQSLMNLPIPNLDQLNEEAEINETDRMNEILEQDTYQFSGNKKFTNLQRKNL